MGTAHFKKEPSAREVTNFLGRLCRKIGRRPGHLITDHGPQFTAEEFDAWCRPRGIQQRFGAIGKYGSLAVIERFIKSMKNECTRLLPIVPLAPAAFGRELNHFVAWYDAERPHSRFGARTPDEIYFGLFPACRRVAPRSIASRCGGCDANINAAFASTPTFRASIAVISRPRDSSAFASCFRWRRTVISSPETALFSHRAFAGAVHEVSLRVWLPKRNAPRTRSAVLGITRRRRLFFARVS